MVDDQSALELRDLRILLLCCFLLGLLANYLFYAKQLGISYPLFTGIFLIIVFTYLKSLNLNLQKPGLWLLLPVLLLSATFALHTNETLLILNFLAIPFLLIAQTLLTAGANRYHWFDIRFIFDILEGTFGRTLGNIAIPFKITRDLGKVQTDQQRYDVLKRVLTGIVIALPLLLVVIPLLSSADLVFSHYLGRLPEYLRLIRLGELIGRTLLIMVITVFSFAYVQSFRSRSAEIISGAESFNKPLELKTRWDPISVSTFLTLLNLVYITFVVIQFSYLFGGGQFTLPAGYTYAEYARQGFFELVVVTLINFSIYILVVNFVNDSRRHLYNLFRMLLSLLAVSTLILLISSFFRLALYEEAYGYTFARVAAHALIIYLFILFLAAIYRIWQEKFALLKSFIVVSLVAYLIFNFSGIDRFIAASNIERYFKTGEIDVHYLTYLSDDAVPQLVTLLEVPDNDVAPYIENDLYLRKERLSDPKWQSFNWSRSRAAAILRDFQLEWQTLDYQPYIMD
jgi:hypothetical protein